MNAGALPTREERLAAAASGMTLALHARVAPDRMAIASPSGDRTFGELNANANRLVRALRARGLSERDSLVLVCANRPEFAEVLAACQRMGLRATPANWHLTARELAYIVSDSDASVVVADARFASAVVAATEGVLVRLAVAGAIDGFESYEDALAEQPSDDISDAVAGTTMLYTSGTTGQPKGVDRPPAAVQATPLTAAMASASRYAATDVHLCTGPLYHAAPLAFSLSAPLAYGVGVVLMDGWDAEETLRLIERHRVTHTHMVPTMFHRLLALPKELKQRHDLSTLRFVLHGAAPCPVPVKQAVIEWLGPVVYEYYAATEGGGTFVGPEEWLKKPGTVGHPVDEGLIRILDPVDGTELGPREIGTVYLRAPAQGRFRYHKDDIKTQGSYLGDYFTLGDHGYLDEDGYLFLTGRSSELIISGGVNIYPAEVDAVLLMHPAVADAGTIGIPDDEWGEVVRSVIELKKDVAASAELAHELVVWCQDHLAHFKCPRAVDFIDELPRHDNGKLYRRKLREMYVT